MFSFTIQPKPVDQTQKVLSKEEDLSLFKLCLKRWIALGAAWLLACLVWHFNPFFQKTLSFAETKDLLWNASFIWVFLGLAWELAGAKFFSEKYLQTESQAVLAWGAIFKGFRNLAENEKQALLFLALRFFYLPLMVQFCVTHLLSFKLPENLLSWGDWLAYLKDFGWLQNTLYLFDTIPFTFAYFINFGPWRTRSVDSSFWGWFFCLSCYPPFNGAWGELFAYSHEEFLSWWGWVSLALILVYVWASLALGLRSGHLQYRGLCDKGPYAIIRHPAYVSKTAAWLVGHFGWCYLQLISGSELKDAILAISLNTVACCFWTWLYYQRALTEERHLSKYPEYREYCNKVKYRYIPGVF